MRHRSGPRRVLVTGAAGLVGRAVLAELTAAGIETTALVLPGMAKVPATRVVWGDARDPAAVLSALDGVDAVIHLAALPSPAHGTPEEVFSTNTLATFVVLDAAGVSGVRNVAIASSFAVCGVTFAPRPTRLPYLPVDSDLPLQVADPYGLSKQVDETTAAMMARRHGFTVVAVRLPLVGDPDDRLPNGAARYADDPASGVSDVWSYLDARDAAHALHLAVLINAPGQSQAVFVAAPDTLAPYPTDALLDRFLPDVPRHTKFPGRTVAIDLAPAQELLGFHAQHVWPVQPRDLEDVRVLG